MKLHKKKEGNIFFIPQWDDRLRRVMIFKHGGRENQKDLVLFSSNHYGLCMVKTKNKLTRALQKTLSLCVFEFPSNAFFEFCAKYLMIYSKKVIWGALKVPVN